MPKGRSIDGPAAQNLDSATTTQNKKNKLTFYKRLDEALKQIRLLEIVSTSPDIACKLSTISLNKNPAFTTISYVWGDLRATHDILLEGQTVSITKYPAEVLEHAHFHWKACFPDREFGLTRFAYMLNDIE